MWSALRQWWGGGSATSPTPSPGARPAPARSSLAEPPNRPTGTVATPADAVADDEVDALLDAQALDCRFSALLLQVTALNPGEMSSAEHQLLKQLQALVRQPGEHPLVPRQPAALPRLMSLLRRDEVSTLELSEHLATDPALLGEVMRLANSPRYRTTRPIDSVHGAVMILGQTGMQQLLVRTMMGPVFDGRQGRFSRHAAAPLWAQAERCAYACAWLRSAPHEQFDAYLAGMVANTGLIAAIRLLDPLPADQPAPASLMFHRGLLTLSAALSARIAQSWSFPLSVLDTLVSRAQSSAQAQPERPLSDLGLALRAAERLSMLHLMAADLGITADSFAGREQHCFAALERAFGGD